FFQAEDGIRDRNVTGVQTCALPIYGHYTFIKLVIMLENFAWRAQFLLCNMKSSKNYIHVPYSVHQKCEYILAIKIVSILTLQDRSEERRVGKEMRVRM